jgi:hypothetical protein
MKRLFPMAAIAIVAAVAAYPLLVTAAEGDEWVSQSLAGGGASGGGASAGGLGADGSAAGDLIVPGPGGGGASGGGASSGGLLADGSAAGTLFSAPRVITTSPPTPTFAYAPGTERRPQDTAPGKDTRIARTTARPISTDQWRYKFYESNWWYWTGDCHWLVWSNNCWVPYEKWVAQR